MENKKIGKKIDKLIMGAIIGGAIGSVLGVTFAPKSGKEMRKTITDKSKNAYLKSKVATENFMDTHKDQIESAKNTSKSIFKKIFWRLKKKASLDSSDREKSGIKNIPVESIDLTIEREEK